MVKVLYFFFELHFLTISKVVCCFDTSIARLYESNWCVAQKQNKQVHHSFEELLKRLILDKKCVIFDSLFQFI